ncbi:hypothetical protein K2173_006331 [Erythroxylum novogranatense]|uniref:Uncharacterized protein n=1 Tax=Erythroxylum novogranatense TaxID=1862640 RepID=A0AAV8U8M6_9ROSI|nr:hypothetical protein K2173_006331 [Erythroxylum novogranatense]
MAATPMRDSCLIITFIGNLVYRFVKVGRISGHKAQEIQRFWLMRHDEVFANRRKQLKKSRS